MHHSASGIVIVLDRDNSVCAVSAVLLENPTDRWRSRISSLLSRSSRAGGLIRIIKADIILRLAWSCSAFVGFHRSVLRLTGWWPFFEKYTE